MVRNTRNTRQQSANLQFSVEETADLMARLRNGEADAIEDIQLNKIAFPAIYTSQVTSLLESVGLRFSTRDAGKTPTWMLDAALGVAAGTVVAKDHVTRRESTIVGKSKFDELFSK